jgi:flagellar biosynthesis protein FlhB
MADEERDANERTEDPTPKRLDEAIRRGDVAKSSEVNTWFMLAGGTMMIMVFAAPMATSLKWRQASKPCSAACSPSPTKSPPMARRWRR